MVEEQVRPVVLHGVSVGHDLDGLAQAQHVKLAVVDSQVHQADHTGRGPGLLQLLQVVLTLQGLLPFPVPFAPTVPVSIEKVPLS